MKLLDFVCTDHSVCDLLAEKSELTSGSTWHAAGNVTFFGHYPSITRLYVDSVGSYLNAQSESDISIGFHRSGSLRLATTSEEIESFTNLQSVFDEMQVTFRVIGADEIKQLHPLLTLSLIHISEPTRPY